MQVRNGCCSVRLQQSKKGLVDQPWKAEHPDAESKWRWKRQIKKNTQVRIPPGNSSLIHMHCYFSKFTHWVKCSEYTMVETCSESATPHPLASIPLQLLAKPSFLPFFPSCNIHSHNTANTQKAQIPHPSYKKSCSSAGQMPRIQGQVSSRDQISGGFPGKDLC